MRRPAPLGSGEYLLVNYRVAEPAAPLSNLTDAQQAPTIARPVTDATLLAHLLATRPAGDGPAPREPTLTSRWGNPASRAPLVPCFETQDEEGGTTSQPTVHRREGRAPP